MNIFNHYGIKEVADVTFYSITRVGDEEFYTPVLFFDTLKVSTLSEANQVETASGGKGNHKVISWAWNQDITMSLEDALFSEASMDVFINGRLESKLSDWTSAIAKLNVANKYGKLHYSTKAYPSPELTMSEWEIIFRCAQKAGYSAKFGDCGIENPEYCQYQYTTIAGDSDADAYVAENRKILTERYRQRSQISPKSYNIGYYYDFVEGYSGVDIRILYTSWEAVENGESISVQEETADAAQLSLIDYLHNIQSTKEQKTVKITLPILLRYTYNGETQLLNKTISIWITVLPTGSLYCRATYIDGDMFKNNYCGHDALSNHIFFYMFPTKLGDFMDLCYCDLQDKIFLAMPQIIIKEIKNEIDTIRKIGYIDNDLYQAQYIDRFESCIVKDKNGFAIDALQQRENLERKYRDDKTESYTIYYDTKTMLPLFAGETFSLQSYSKQYTKLNNCSFSITSLPDAQQIVYAGMSLLKFLTNSLEEIKNMVEQQIGEAIDHVEDVIFDGSTGDIKIEGGAITFLSPLLIKYVPQNPNIFKLKKGTRYLKWTRTVNTSDNLFTTVGVDLLLSKDTFPSEYKVVGETYIREQKTGKDQRCQIVLNRVKLSSQTDIKLTADGDPVTFSLDIDVLQGKGEDMMKMTFFDVEPDAAEGGFRIVPQNTHYCYTPIIQDNTTPVIDNNEIY